MRTRRSAKVKASLSATRRRLQPPLDARTWTSCSRGWPRLGEAARALRRISRSRCSDSAPQTVSMRPWRPGSGSSAGRENPAAIASGSTLPRRGSRIAGGPSNPLSRAALNGWGVGKRRSHAGGTLFGLGVVLAVGRHRGGSDHELEVLAGGGVVARIPGRSEFGPRTGTAHAGRRATLTTR